MSRFVVLALCASVGGSLWALSAADVSAGEPIAGASPVMLDGSFSYLGIGSSLPGAISAAGLPRVPFFEVEMAWSSAQSNTMNSRCSTQQMDGSGSSCSTKVFTGWFGCSAINNGSFQAACSSANLTLGSAVHQCSVEPGAPGVTMCSSDDQGGAGSAHCSAMGSNQAGSPECSALGGSGSSWCSAVTNGGSGQTTCSSYGNGSQCSVVAGSGNSCTTNGGGTAGSCSAQGGGQCSSFAPGGGGSGAFGPGPANPPVTSPPPYSTQTCQ